MNAGIRPKDPETIEEELALFAEAIEAGIDPFPEPRKETPWAKYATAWFMIVLMISFVSKALNRAL
tara:strand:+ start:3893 stop:4090 length:198 start_codon:yes stop_codon:yes gene_type:complete